MEDLFSLVKIIRKVEALFLPLLPSSFQQKPPSYRLGAVWIEKLTRHENESKWKSALLYYIKNYLYRAYHEKGLASQGQLSETEIKWMRCILAVMAAVILAAFIPKAELLSPLIKGILLLGSSILILFGSALFSISALWAAWGFLFPILGATALESAPWSLFFLSCWVLIWHLPALKKGNSWSWYDWVATLPVLFFWMDVIRWIPSWTRCQNAYLSVILWGILWTALIVNKNALISKSIQLFLPSSLLCFFLTLTLGKTWFSGLVFFRNWRWVLWVAATFSLGMILSKISPAITAFKSLFRFSTFIVIFLIFGALICFFSNRDFLYDQIDTSAVLLGSATWPLWWFIGAGIIMFIRKTTMVLLNWIQALLPSWLLPVSLFVFPAAALYFDWIPFLIQAVGKNVFFIAASCLALVSCIFAFLKKENALREWIFWSMYIIFLLQRHWSSAHRMAYETSAELNLTGFLLLAFWLMWLGYDVVGEKLSEYAKNDQDRRKTAALLGAFLWLLASSLWSSYIDLNLNTRQEIQLNLFMGFNFFGCPFIIYRMILGERLNNEVLPWPWILLAGIGLVQLLQGVEHYLVGFIQGWTPDELHSHLYSIHVIAERPIESIMPKWVLDPSWNYLCRFERWLAAMSLIIFLISFIKAKPEYRLETVLSVTCLTSLAAGVTESYWFQWPSMSPFWSVIFRPWQIDRTLLSWGLRFLEFFSLYALAGIAWGLVFTLVQRTKTVTHHK
ncbi:MAG: hypothetical protein JXA35_04525 [Deltaproteobacteria bacterium]|nr:hypothetical protein [Deltaproteobacteria bacterium]